MKRQRHIAIVPAKKKSRRCENKNWREFAQGQSLVERKFLTALASGLYQRVYLSTDFQIESLDELFATSRWNEYQLNESPGGRFRVRPRFMKDDSVEVVLDVLNWMGAADDEYYHLLQPTSPFVQNATLDVAKKCVVANRCAVVAVNPAYKPCGAVYSGIVGNLRESKSFYHPFVMTLQLDWMESIDIDHEYDFQIARNLME